MVVGFRTSHSQGGLLRRMGDHMRQDILHLRQQRIGHCLGESVANKDALDHQIFAMWWHRVGRYQPASLAQAISKVIEAKVRRRRIF